MNQLSHLPENKQQELAKIVEIIREIADPARVILFGSHTSDKWVEDEYIDRGTTYWGGLIGLNNFFVFLNYYAASLYTCIGVLSFMDECILLWL